MNKIQLAITIYIITLLPTFLLLSKYDPSFKEKTPFDTQLKFEIENKQPKYVFIGNSMLGSRIDELLIEDLTESKVFIFSNNGSASSQWYLFFKNFVLDLDSKPKVFFFFREILFTEPNFRTDKEYEDVIESLMTENEPRYMDILKNSERTITEDVLGVFNKDSYKKAIDETLQTGVLHAIQLPQKKAFIEDTNYYFNLDNFRLTEIQDIQTQSDSRYLFNETVENSFLSEVVSLSKESQIEVVFIRVKRRPSEDGLINLSNQVISYNQAMDEYLVSHGITIYDFTYDKKISSDWYLDGDHISKTNKYTKHFYTALQHEFY